MRRNRAFLPAVAGLLVLLVALGAGAALTFADTSVRWSVFGSGGTSSSSTSYRLGSSVGQSSPIGESGSTSYELCAGFWCGVALDDDGDGCTNAAEQQPKAQALSGGGRDPQYFWDFYDVWSRPLGDPQGWERDRVVNVPGDIIGVVSRFGPGTAQNKEDALAAALTPPVSAAGYHAAFDRGPVIGANNWNRAPADGAINIPDDILGVAAQFGHNCL